MTKVETNLKSNNSQQNKKLVRETDPLVLLLDKYHFQTGQIKKIVSGSKYTAVELKNKNIGVCANRGFTINTEQNSYNPLILSSFGHRVVLNAYFNALLNNDAELNGEDDIFDAIDFKKYQKPVMLGYFKPLIKKFNEAGIEVSIFDPGDKEIMSYLDSCQEDIASADALILTATSISNGSFLKSIQPANANCDIFLLGPSAVMSQDMAAFDKIQKIFGTTFSAGDQRVLEVIANNGGTKDFQPYGKKEILKLTYS